MCVSFNLSHSASCGAFLVGGGGGGGTTFIEHICSSAGNWKPISLPDIDGRSIGRSMIPIDW